MRDRKYIYAEHNHHICYVRCAYIIQRIKKLLTTNLKDSSSTKCIFSQNCDHMGRVFASPDSSRLKELKLLLLCMHAVAVT